MTLHLRKRAGLEIHPGGQLPGGSDAAGFDWRRCEVKRGDRVTVRITHPELWYPMEPILTGKVGILDEHGVSIQDGDITNVLPWRYVLRIEASA